MNQSENIIKLTCKNLDVYKAFLSRLNKVSDKFIRKNDTLVNFTKNEFKAFGGRIPGSHFVLDPFIDLSTGAYMRPNEPFCTYTIRDIIQRLLDINNNTPELRKTAAYHQCVDEACDYIEFKSTDTMIRVPITKTVEDYTKEWIDHGSASTKSIRELRHQMLNAVRHVDNFELLLREHPKFEWVKLNADELIRIRNYEPINKLYNGMTVRLLKPLFMFAGSLRKNTPIATSAAYRLVMDDDVNNYTGHLQIYATYPCLSGSSLEINAIHEYTILCLNQNDGHHYFEDDNIVM